jgi:hypothetical protein
MSDYKRLHRKAETPRTVRFEREQLAAIRRIEKAEKRSFGNVVRLLISEALVSREFERKEGVA